MIAIVMDINKNLRITSDTILNQFESNADDILCLLPCNYGGIRLSECDVYLCFENIQIKHGKIKLILSPEKYNEQYLKYQCFVSTEMTYVGGKLPVWIEIHNLKKKVLICTGNVFLNIVEKFKIPNETVAEIVPILSKWTSQMIQIKNYADDVLKQANEQANIATKSASIILDMISEINKGV